MQDAPFISVPVSTERFLGLAEAFLKQGSERDPGKAIDDAIGEWITLLEFLYREGSGCDPVDAIGRAIDYWMDNADWKKGDLMPELFEKQDMGYIWKTIFLPHGTRIRMKYKNQTHYANVEGDELIFNGNSISPGKLTETISGSSRNAWRDLWIKRPEDKSWVLADDVRKQALTLDDF